MPTDITETAAGAKGTTISVPVGTDTRTAASLMNAWQAIGNRLAWLEAFVERIAGTEADVETTGELVPPDNLVIDLSDGRLDIIGNDDNNINLGGLAGSPGGVQLFCNGLLAAHLFTEGRTGRANEKVFVATPGANTTIDALLYNCYLGTPSADINLQIDLAGSTGAGAVLKKGDVLHVCNYSTSFAISVRDPSAVQIIALAAAPSAEEPAWCDVVYNGSAWKTLRHNQ